MEWNGICGLDSRLLCLPVGQPRFPKVTPCPGQHTSFKYLNPEARIALSAWVNFPFTGGGAMPAMGAMREPIPRPICFQPLSHYYGQYIHKIIFLFEKRSFDKEKIWSSAFLFEKNISEGFEVQDRFLKSGRFCRHPYRAMVIIMAEMVICPLWPKWPYGHNTQMIVEVR